jgi:hypothetical protein
MKAEGVAERLRKDATLLDKIMAECVMDSEKYWKDRAALAWN